MRRRAGAAGVAGKGSHRLTSRAQLRQQVQGSQVLGSDLTGGLWRMRHITGFFLALATSAALFFGAGWGVWRFTAMQSGQGVPGIAAWTNTHNVFPLAALLGTGLMIGIFFAVR